MAPDEGRALFAANATLDWPDHPLDVLWQAATLLREHRGDGHVALLLAEGPIDRASNVLHPAAGNVPKAMIARARDYDNAQSGHGVVDVPVWAWAHDGRR